jgi:hypothetical protein
MARGSQGAGQSRFGAMAADPLNGVVMTPGCHRLCVDGFSPARRFSNEQILSDEV